MDLTPVVNSIRLAPEQSFLGIQPILSMYFKTDDFNSIITKLVNLSKTDAEALIQCVTTTLNNTSYPFNKSVFQFNDPQIEISNLNHVLSQEDKTDFWAYIYEVMVYSDTYPFLETYTSELPEASVLAFEGNPLSLRDSITNSEERENPPPRNDSVPPKPLNLLVPTLTFGSMYLLTKYAYKEDSL